MYEASKFSNEHVERLSDANQPIYKPIDNPCEPIKCVDLSMKKLSMPFQYPHASQEYSDNVTLLLQGNLLGHPLQSFPYFSLINSVLHLVNPFRLDKVPTIVLEPELEITKD